MGTPGEECWPGVTDLPDWSPAFPQWRPRALAELVPQLDGAGLDLLASMLRLDPTQRVTARQALAHPWFDEVRAEEEARGAATLAAVRRTKQGLQARMAAAAEVAGAAMMAAAVTAAAQAAAAAAAAAVAAVEPEAECAATPAAADHHLLDCDSESLQPSAPAAATACLVLPGPLTRAPALVLCRAVAVAALWRVTAELPDHAAVAAAIHA